MQNFKFLVFCLTLVGILFSFTSQAEKILRYKNQNGEVHYGILKNEMVYRINNDFDTFIEGDFRIGDTGIPLENVTILPPVQPSKVVNLGFTYEAHTEEMGGEENLVDPMMFLKPPTTIIGHREAIEYPEGQTNELEFEAELSIVIGKKAKDVGEENALDYVLGYTCFNDISARDLIRKDPTPSRGKAFDTFGPIGPWIVTGIDPSQLQIKAIHNGEVKQDSNVNQMYYSIPFIVSYVSGIMTLEPGDVINTGTPGGTEAMEKGDTIRVEIENIGTLTNHIE